ncbi:SepM family pheromone-processing serine protease [Sporosarcina sp. HYO08]|uniref:SepM family pheromone-processing serine protease n=1 Tax=Sporosarcina sp. HYO08 TaxID=1759557 RepID=UPI000791652E|nr:SepM family pheromone-processing serine protease [Sporosarcina sp. HYO08]KXH79882.1 peptidase [Sporosarcina sp. HYO08]
MRKKRLGLLGVIIVLLVLLFAYPLDAYITKPGGAYELSPLVQVIGGDKDDQGIFSLLTISVAKATPFLYSVAKLSDYQNILPVHKVRRVGENDKEYNIRQKRLMSDSQFNALTVAYSKVGLPVDIGFNGVFISGIVSGGASDGRLEVGDLIHAVDGAELTESGQFYHAIADRKLGDELTLTVERNDQKLDVEIILAEIPESDGRVGLGIQFEEDRTVKTDPEVQFDTSEIGGPSAGLMFTLEIMNQLLDEDLTKGYKVTGTGEMYEDGTVGRIGGADFKVVAADRKGMEIFFAPADDLPEEVRQANPGIKTNYEEAVEMAEKIGTKMKIVPVVTVDDAIAYLEALQEK